MDNDRLVTPGSWSWERDVRVVIRNARVGTGPGTWSIEDVPDVAFVEIEDDLTEGAVCFTQIGSDVPIPLDAFADMCRSFLTWYTLARSQPVHLQPEWQDGPQTWGDDYWDGKTVAELCWWAYWDSGSTRHQTAEMIARNMALPEPIRVRAAAIVGSYQLYHRGTAGVLFRTRQFELILWAADPAAARAQQFEPQKPGE